MSLTRNLCAYTLSAFLLSACGDKKAENPVLATVNGQSITQLDYAEYQKLREQQQGPIADKTKEHEVVLGEMVNRSLLAQQAKRDGIQKEPDVAFQLRLQEEMILMRGFLRKHLRDHAITDEEVRTRYAQEVEKTHRNEYRARHILVKNEDDARDIITKLKSGADFAKLAKEKSVDVRSGINGGELGWFNQGQMVPEFFSAVTALKPGEMTREPIKSEYGWHVVQAQESRPLNVPPFEQVQANVRQLVQQERIDILIKELKDKAKVSIKTVEVAAPASTETAKPAGTDDKGATP